MSPPGMPRVAAFLLALLAFAAASTADVSVEFFRFSAGRYVRFAIADTAADLSGIAGPLEGLPIYVADEDTMYCYDGGSWSSCNAGGGGGAPTNAEYVVGALHGSLSAERVGTDTAEVDWDFGTAGQAKLNIFSNSLVLSRLKTSDTPSLGECLTVAASDEIAFATCGGAGLSDGDYGDVTVGGSGTTMTVDSGAVGLTELADDASCTGSQNVRRNSGDTAFECYTASGGSSRLPSLLNPPASPHAYDCEFSGDSCSFSPSVVGGSGASYGTGTVDPTQGALTDFVVDYTSWSGYLLAQSALTSDYLVYSESVTLDTNATVCFAPVYVQQVQSAGAADNSEAETRLYLANSGDSNEAVYIRYGRDATSGQLEIENGVNNNGSFSSTDIEIFPALSYALAGPSMSCIWKSGDSYTIGHFGPNGTFVNSGTYTKTGVTTFDEIQLMFTGANTETPNPIMGVDFIRYYPSVTFALMNP